MMTSYFNLLKYAATGQASPDMTYYDRMRASTLMGGVVQTLTGQPPLSFKSDGTPLISWSMKGNGQQTGTPTPDNPVMPTFCGKLVGADWTIPITCAGQTVPVYLGQTQTVRRIKKLVLTGDETYTSDPSYSRFIMILPNAKIEGLRLTQVYCTHFISVHDGRPISEVPNNSIYTSDISTNRFFIKTIDYTSAADFKSYLAAQYTAGTPVTIWYALKTPETTISNEPLCKIGTYADELSSTDAGITIPTIKGSNTLTVDTELQPSEMTITFKG